MAAEISSAQTPLKGVDTHIAVSVDLTGLLVVVNGVSVQNHYARVTTVTPRRADRNSNVAP
jgi:hypothetical protein